MKNNLFFLFAFLFATSITGQDHKEQKVHTVINILGAKVYEKPTFDSKILQTLPVGEKVSIEKEIQSNERFRIGTGFSLAGKWIAPKGIRGYVFSSDLTDKKVEVGTKESGPTGINMLGKLVRKEAAKENINTPHGKFPKFFEFKFYENGTYTNIGWDGCFEHLTQYKNLSLNEIYHQMVSDQVIIMNENQLLIPGFIERIQNKIKFEVEEGTQDLTIELKDDGSVQVTSYDCT